MNESLRVLLVEDCPDQAQLVRLLLRRPGGEDANVTHVDRLATAFALVHEREFDVALLDLGLPDSDGLVAVQKLKSASPTLPIVVLTANENEALALDAIACGAQEYLGKDLMLGDLLNRVIRHSIARQKQLMDAQAQALTDSLTGIANRRCCELEIKRRIAEARRIEANFGLVLFDADHFKQVNDNFGHEAGDHALRMIADVSGSSVRESDLVGRIGGEEFLIVVPTNDPADVVNLAERVREAIAGSSLRVGDSELTVTVSAGLCVYQAGDDFDSLLRRADAALYRAKEDGRNRTCWDADIGATV